MRICAAQLAAVRGDIAANVLRHVALVELAASQGANLVFFPELSLTGYEPSLARDLATDANDPRFDALQAQADARRIIIGVGLPTRSKSGPQVSLIVFRPLEGRLTYSKQRLHADELPWFSSGDEQLVIDAGGHRLAPAICFESLQPEHAGAVADLGADTYLASVAKPHRSVAVAHQHYHSMARRHSMIVLMANCVGPCDDFVGAGRSAAWTDCGGLAAELSDSDEGLVMIDTTTGEAAAIPWAPQEPKLVLSARPIRSNPAGGRP
jgi:predicted amidohydrolase